MTVWYAVWNENCAPSWLYLQDYTRMHSQQNIKKKSGFSCSYQLQCLRLLGEVVQEEAQLVTQPAEYNAYLFFHCLTLEDEGTTVLQNVWNHSPDTVSHPWRRASCHIISYHIISSEKPP